MEGSMGTGWAQCEKRHERKKQASPRQARFLADSPSGGKGIFTKERASRRDVWNPIHLISRSRFRRKRQMPEAGGLGHNDTTSMPLIVFRIKTRSKRTLVIDSIQDLCLAGVELLLRPPNEDYGLVRSPTRMVTREFDEPCLDAAPF